MLYSVSFFDGLPIHDARNPLDEVAEVIEKSSQDRERGLYLPISRREYDITPTAFRTMRIPIRFSVDVNEDGGIFKKYSKGFGQREFEFFEVSPKNPLVLIVLRVAEDVLKLFGAVLYKPPIPVSIYHFVEA